MFKPRLPSPRRLIAKAGLAVTVLMIESQQAMALNGVGQLMNTDQQQQAQPFLTAAVNLSFVAGVCMVIFGVYHGWKAFTSQGRDAKFGTAAGMVVVGSLMTVPSWVTGIGVGTIFSGGGTATQGVVPMSVN